MADNVEELRTDRRPRAWSYFVGVVVFRILNSLYWALVGGLGWGTGVAVGRMVPFPVIEAISGGVGLALAMFVVLTARFGRRSDLTFVCLASFGGIAFGFLTFSFFHPDGLNLLVLLGAGAGFVAGLCSCVMKQYFAPVGTLSAGLIAVIGAALFAGIGTLFGGMVGWAAAGGVSLFCVAILAERFRSEPAIEIGADERPCGVIPRRRLCLRTARQSWSPTATLAWGWHGLLAGLLGSFWAEQASNHLAPETMRIPLLACSVLAVVLILAQRSGVMRTAP